MRYFLALAILFMANLISAQYEDLVFDDHIYVPYIKSVTFAIENEARMELESSALQVPITNINATVGFVLKFDDIEEGEHEFIYDIIHCDRNWNPSDIDNLQYLDGFTEEEIDNVEFSSQTVQSYARYSLRLPNDDLRWTLSGNYLLVVYDLMDDKKPVLSRRFMVLDSKITINRQSTNTSDPLKYNTHQEFDFNIDYKNFRIDDPLNNITAVVLQNNRWDNAIMDIKPKFTNEDLLVFDYDDRIVFPALKEYRNFDTRTLQSASFNVNTIELNEDGTDVLLDLQEPRSFELFHTRSDANGGFINYAEDRRDQQMSAEYTNVIFVLSVKPLKENVHVVGAFNNYQMNEASQLHYDERRGAYMGQVFLKQGYYDFMFGIETEDGLDISTLEGSWYETENDYLIMVYYTSRYEGYDQLIGISSFNSNDVDRR